MRDLTDQLPPDAEPEFVHEEEQDDVSKIQSLLKELDMAGGVARIFRQRPGQAKHEYEGEIPADTFTLETIKRYYGGGDYQVRFAAKGGRYVRSIRFSIDPRHKGEIDKIHETPAPVTNQNDNSQALLAFMMQQQQTQAQQSQQSMTLMMTMMAESQKSMAAIIAAALSGRQTPVQDSSSKFIEVVMPMLTESMKPKGGIAEFAETVKIAKDLIGPAPEKEEKDDMLEKMMTIGAPLLGAFMARGQAQQPQPQPIRANPVQPPPPPSLPPSAEQVAQAKAQELLGKLRFVTPILVRAAKKGSYIDSYLEILEDNLDDEGHEMLVFMLQRDDWISTLFNDNPDVVANKAWFESLREAILAPPDETTPGEETAEPGKVPEAPHPFQ